MFCAFITIIVCSIAKNRRSSKQNNENNTADIQTVID